MENISMDEISILAFFKFKKTKPAEISKRTRVCIHWSFRKQKCRLKSTTTNGWRHFGQSEQRKSSVLFPIQSEKSPDSGLFTCDPTKKCIMPSSRETHKGIIGRGHDLRLLPMLFIAIQSPNRVHQRWGDEKTPKCPDNFDWDCILMHSILRIFYPVSRCRIFAS